MGKIIVGVGKVGFSMNVEKNIITYALGSCIGITLYDPIARVGGILHFMLPDSKINPKKAATNPYMFADTGIPLFFNRAYRYGAKKNRIIVNIIGGASILDEKGHFDIGKKNIFIAKTLLSNNNITIKTENTGGDSSRTVELYMETGVVLLKTPNKGKKFL